jgi:hypothetical protein
MKMTPELKAFRHYKKNIDHYIEEMSEWWGDDEKQEQMYKRISDKFNANYKKLMEINYISYKRSVERAFK